LSVLITTLISWKTCKEFIAKNISTRVWI